MVDTGTRVKNKKFRRTPGSKTVIHYSRDKKSTAKCAVTGVILQGTGNQTKSDSRKDAKSKRRPSVKFGGVLSSKVRREVWDNYVLVKENKKEINDVPSKIKQYVESQTKKVSK